MKNVVLAINVIRMEIANTSPPCVGQQTKQIVIDILNSGHLGGMPIFMMIFNF